MDSPIVRVAVIALALAACDHDSPTSRMPEVCGPYPDWESSAYTLPYEVGEAFVVGQANCTEGGHQGRYKHSYDFLMPIGTVVTAARAGTVTFVEEGFGDDTTTIEENNFRSCATWMGSRRSTPTRPATVCWSRSATRRWGSGSLAAGTRA
ncbi:MAG: hypothetical protein R2991_04380 [Thermoanaerobaculia bacterium]